MMWSVILILILLIPILAIVLDSQVGRALAARLERGPTHGADRALLERLGTLEGEVERLTSEMARIEEESQFLQRLLTERAGDPGTGQGRLGDGEHEG
jgi:hypothetical protein